MSKLLQNNHKGNRFAGLKALAVTGVAGTLALGGLFAGIPANAADENVSAQKSISNEEAQKMRENAVIDSSVLDKAVKDAADKGVKVDVNAECTLLPSNLEDLKTQKDRLAKDYTDQAGAINDGLAKYQAKLDEYNKAKAEYDKVVDDQTKNADPTKAIQVDKLAVDSPWTDVANNNSLVPPGGWTALKRGDTITDPATGKVAFSADRYYASTSANYISATQVKEGETYLLEWKNIKKDKETGRLLGVRVKIADIKLSPEGDKEDDNANPTYPYIIAYSNSADNISIQGIASLSQSPEYYYSDTGELYEKPFYETVASLNAQGAKGERYEFTTPGTGIIASFEKSGSPISSTLLPLSGAAKDAVPGGAGFMIPPPKSEPVPHEDIDLGVTYLMKNGAKYYTGVSGSNGQPAQQVLNADGSLRAYATYMHLISDSATVAPTAVKPVPPEKPVFAVNKCQLVVPDPHKYDLDENFNDVNKKPVKKGDVLNYTVVGDTTGLKRTTPAVTKFAILDTYDAAKVKPLLGKVKVYQLPAGTKNDQAGVAEALKAGAGKDVTTSFDIADTKAKGLVATLKGDGKGSFEQELGFLYALVMPSEVIVDQAGDIKNTASQITNENGIETETVVNPVDPPQPSPTPTPTPSPTPTPPVPPAPPVTPTSPVVVNPPVNPGNPAPPVKPAGIGAPAAQSSSPSLAYTGASGLGLLGAKALMLVLGGVALYVAKKRKTKNDDLVLADGSSDDMN